jgi:pimeloyl-ACP methyl ester carboxylesterase
MPSERAYLAWPLAITAPWLFDNKRQLLRHLGLAALCGGLLVAVELLNDNGLRRWELTRVAWCGLGAIMGIHVARTGLAHAWRTLTRRKHDSKWVRLAGSALWYVVLVCALGPTLLSYMQVHPLKWHGRATPRSALSLEFETVTFRSADGTTLSAWFVPANGSNRTVLLCHGVMDHKGGMMEFISHLHQASYNVLALDFRGHGHSGGWTVTYGNREREDIIAALDWLQDDRPYAAQRIAGVGWSMGASCLILAAAEDARLEALFLDAPYASARQMARHIGRSMHPWVATWMFYAGTTLASFESATNLFTLSPAETIGCVAPRPVYIVHGENDVVIPCAQGRAVFDHARAPREWHLIQGAGHCGTLAHEGAAYVQRLIRFLDEVMGPHRPHAL